MFTIILVSHASVSTAMIDNVMMVMGKQEGLYPLEINPEDSPDELIKHLEQLLLSLKEKENIVILSDFSLGTPFNLICNLSQKYSFNHLTGMNLPLLINLLKNRTSSLPIEDICKKSLEIAKAQMYDVNEYLKELSS